MEPRICPLPQNLTSAKFLTCAKKSKSLESASVSCVIDGGVGGVGAQALVNWADMATVEDVWVTTSGDMPPNSAVFENWNRLFLSRVLGVPGAAYVDCPRYRTRIATCL